MHGEELGVGQGKQGTSKTLGGPIELNFESTSESRPHTESNFDAPHMVGKIFS
jgi:hypothetical protein